MDLWNFNKESLRKSLQKSNEELPDSILREQAEALRGKTDGIVYGKISNMKYGLKSGKETYTMATMFDVVVPKLESYHYTMFIMFSRPEKSYPVAITVGRSITEEQDKLTPQYVCRNEKEFMKALKEILSSEEVTETIETLYLKALKNVEENF